MVVINYTHIIVLVVLVVLFSIICYQLFRNREYKGIAEYPNRKKFRSVAATKYSVAGPLQVAQEIEIFKSLFKNNPPKSIIDATAHVGVDSVTFAYTFPDVNVTSVEIDTNTYEKLKYNIVNLGYGDRIKAVNMSADVYLSNLDHNVDLIYIAPPWGGRGYSSVSDLPLYDNDGNPTIPLSKVINIALKKTELVIINAPYNFMVEEFKNNIDGDIESIRKIHRIDITANASFIYIIIRPKKFNSNRINIS